MQSAPYCTEKLENYQPCSVRGRVTHEHGASPDHAGKEACYASVEASVSSANSLAVVISTTSSARSLNML